MDLIKSYATDRADYLNPSLTLEDARDTFAYLIRQFHIRGEIDGVSMEHVRAAWVRCRDTIRANDRSAK